MKNKIQPQKLTAPPRAPEAATVKPYPLETIMALQKALEAGLDEKEQIAPAPPLASHRKTSARPSPLAAFIQRFWKPILNGMDRVEQHLQLILMRKKRSKLTSAR